MTAHKIVVVPVMTADTEFPRFSCARWSRTTRRVRAPAPGPKFKTSQRRCAGRAPRRRPRGGLVARASGPGAPFPPAPDPETRARDSGGEHESDRGDPEAERPEPRGLAQTRMPVQLTRDKQQARERHRPDDRDPRPHSSPSSIADPDAGPTTTTSEPAGKVQDPDPRTAQACSPAGGRSDSARSTDHRLLRYLERDAYRPLIPNGLSHDLAVRELRDNTGTQFGTNGWSRDHGVSRRRSLVRCCEGPHVTRRRWGWRRPTEGMSTSTQSPEAAVRPATVAIAPP
jgi:hypothetical protein